MGSAKVPVWQAWIQHKWPLFCAIWWLAWDTIGFWFKVAIGDPWLAHRCLHSFPKMSSVTIRICAQATGLAALWKPSLPATIQHFSFPKNLSTSISQWERNSLISSKRVATSISKQPNQTQSVTFPSISNNYLQQSRRCDRFECILLFRLMNFFSPFSAGAALAHNPVGLAAYILEKFSTWTDKNNRDAKDGGLDKAFAKDALFDNLMIYYLTNSITTSVRLYAEAFAREHQSLKMERVPVTVPVGCARFKHDLAHSFDWQLSGKYPKLVHSTYHRNGGHFAAMELPDVLYNDFIQFVKKLNITQN